MVGHQFLKLTPMVRLEVLPFFHPSNLPPLFLFQIGAIRSYLGSMTPYDPKVGFYSKLVRLEVLRLDEFMLPII